MKAQKNGGGVEIPKLTIEEINTQDSFRNLSQEQKLDLISFLYQLSLVLYNTYTESDE